MIPVKAWRLMTCAISTSIKCGACSEPEFEKSFASTRFPTAVRSRSSRTADASRTITASLARRGPRLRQTPVIVPAPAGAGVYAFPPSSVFRRSTAAHSIDNLIGTFRPAPREPSASDGACPEHCAPESCVTCVTHSCMLSACQLGNVSLRASRAECRSHSAPHYGHYIRCDSPSRAGETEEPRFS
jgi:hypothetical protein